MKTLSFCAVIATMLLWGCGDEPMAPGAMSQATTVATAIAFQQVSAGGDRYGEHTCGIGSNGLAYCWGNNLYGELGIGSQTGPESCHFYLDSEEMIGCSTRPVLVAGGHTFLQVASGDHYTCGIASDHRAFCWGANYTGQLGDGTTTTRLTPTVVAGGLRFRQIATGFNHTCGVSYPDNMAYCWGNNLGGELGDRSNTIRHSPVPVFGGRLFRQVTTGDWFSCGITTDSLAYCWGLNRSGQVGDSTQVGYRQRPVRVAGSHRFRQIDAGGAHTCAVAADRRAWCWGSGDYGALGNNKQAVSYWPKAVGGGLFFDRVSAGESMTCGEASGDRTYCWGFYSTEGASLVPTLLPGGLLFRQVTAGTMYGCGRTSSNLAYCWGYNQHGAVGDGTTVDRSAPVAVVGPS